MSVKDLNKRLAKCDDDHEQQVKDCTNKELETKEAMEKATAAHNCALTALKNARETRISDRLEIVKEFIDNEIKVDLKLSKYDREDVTKLMIELRQIRSKHATIEDRVEIAKRFWRLKSYFVKFPLLMRIKAALEKKRPDWKIEFRPNYSNGKNIGWLPVTGRSKRTKWSIQAWMKNGAGSSGTISLVTCIAAIRSSVG